MIKIECGSCRATGLYSGLCEGPGKAVICIKCKGTGCQEVAYASSEVKLFTSRQRRHDIKTVYRGGGTFIFGGAGPKGNGISYEAFFSGQMP